MTTNDPEPPPPAPTPKPAELELAAEFSPATHEQWLRGVEAVLMKGRPDAGPDAFAEAFRRRLVHRTEDGIEVRPLYTADDGVPDPGRPGFAPFVRGAAAAPSSWEVRQRVWIDAEGSAARHELESGATGVWIDQSETLDVDELDRVLDGVLLDLAPITVSAPDAVASARALVELWDRRSIAPEQRRGTLGVDPVGRHARSGGASDLDAEIKEAVEMAAEVLVVAPRARTIVVDATTWHDAGATDAQELAWATATGATYVRALVAGGLTVDQALASLEFRFAATADQFATIAKLRAARRLWARVAEVAGAPERARGQHQHAETSRAMLTRYDPWVNVLRSTVACFGAGVGGAAAVTVLPHDVLRLPGGSRLGRRVARNTQSVLLAETNLARVVDPAGGSWFVESLTDELAHTAWRHVKDVEASGGIADALRAGVITEHVDAALGARRRVVGSRARPITGVTEFPDLGEVPPSRSDQVGDDAAGGGEIDTPFPPLVLHRLAEAFEHQRGRADRTTSATGSRPTVYLAVLGPPVVHTARATFAKNLFEVGGIGTVSGPPASFAASGSTIACLCSSDAVYASDAATAVAELRGAGATQVYLAGRNAAVDDVDEEIGMGVDVLDVLTRALDQLGAQP